MLNDLLGVFLKVLLGFFEKLLITPIFNFLDAALFGSKDPLA
jgi:hypothetical protein